MQSDKEKVILAALIGAFNDQDGLPSRNEIASKATLLAPLLGYSGDLQNIVTEAETAIPSHMNAGVSLIDVDAAHDEEWIHKREIETTYADAYGGYLRSQGWKPNIVNTLLNGDGSKILGLLQDPTSEGAWSRRGLVIGHVQSGKTANYMGVIAKAADAGYKFIIVIAGIHNNLRKQTQQRVDEGFVGRKSDPADRVSIGVGLDKNYPNPVTLTNILSDFNKQTADKSGAQLNDFKKPVIIVIKKNVKTLEALYIWLRELNAEGRDRIGDVPMLVIDDEADNASINTNKPNINPTATNAWIRKILRLFTKNCYVGYTATPFANIFIDPDAFDEKAYEELFPKDFIYSLDAPTTYFGPKKVLLNDESSSAILRQITDCEEYLPLTHKNGSPVAELPPSLYRALDQFIVARAIRNLRGQERKHCSMLVNVSRFVSVQKEVRSFISLRLDRMREAVKANYMMPEAASSKNEHMARLHAAFDAEFAANEFGGRNYTWDEVKAALWGVFENTRTYVVNSKSDEVLDFAKYEKDGIGLTAIAIGGLSLSRGLTIEGLTISYMYRNTKMYDTLMQMGRWFGYRPGYEDVCRVWLPNDSINWYKHIALASEELRQQITRMRQAEMSPRDFGLYVRSHPDSLMVTAASKMRSGEKVVLNQNLTGTLQESWLLPLDAETKINKDNEKLIEEYWRDGFGGTVKPTEKGWFIPDVDVGKIDEFLLRFKTHKSARKRKADAIEYLLKIAPKFPKADVLLISKGLGDPAAYRLGAQDRTAAKDATPDKWLVSGYRVASRGDEKLGLTDDQIAEAEKLASDDMKSKKKKPSDVHYRMVRKKPLLMIHVLEPTENPDFAGYRVPAWGLSFPDGLYGADYEIEVIANKVWMEEMYGAMDDDPDADEDYDDE
ncbi:MULTISPECIES: Z1 domain-containing protein [Gluconobacter]|uniref:Endonuclease n=1 Tax=Gluconobacter cadivus TaxID=2728101 RepID=A0ABR9YTX7_9PROT|nr:MULTISPECIES: Z1 domain-containing protein [Gluconobacter]MBF0887825.1 endonuclease [Gluconobacter cadivus]MBS1058408.1 endonuclease [Gluconobacter sp. Dm-44]